MKTQDTIHASDVKAVYSGPEGDLWELIMGQQIHIGGLTSSRDLAERARVPAGGRGVDLCCCNGAGMRFLLRFCGLAHVTGVDFTPHVLERARERCAAEGWTDKVSLVRADVTATGLPGGAFDVVWGEDAWCYVENKSALIREAARLVKSGGVVAFTDWVEGPGLTQAEAARFDAFMKFPTLASIADYRQELQTQGLKVECAEDTGRYARCIELYIDMLSLQLTSDALRIIGYDEALFQALAGEMMFIRDLARAGKVQQARFVARRA